MDSPAANTAEMSSAGPISNSQFATLMESLNKMTKQFDKLEEDMYASDFDDTENSPERADDSFQPARCATNGASLSLIQIQLKLNHLGTNTPHPDQKRQELQSQKFSILVQLLQKPMKTS